MTSERTTSLLSKEFSRWDAKELAEYLSDNGLEDYAECFISNNVDGEIAHRIDRDELKKMGVSKVGARLKILEVLGSLKRAKQQLDQEELLWEGKEVMYASCCHQMYETCFGLFPQNPSEYRLNSHHLVIKEIKVPRCGPMRCCCISGNYFIDNIDLSNVKDIDLEGSRPGCLCQIFCCEKKLEHIIVGMEGKDESKVLIQKSGEAQDVVRKIKNQIEILQRMQRS
mmetsp:Transcript_17867/g.27063  ORF Transcript_17867/g.27063 Transcript_17867/m.27063 type:complete len:226 (-) Transcript_17867:226-903(-)